MTRRVLARLAAALVAATVLQACAARTPPRVLPPLGGPGAAVVRTAETLVGAPYRDGGADPSGFDCSGLVAYVFAQHGTRLPRAVAQQASAGRPIGAGEIRAGDLLFFTTTGPGATHVSIAVDGHRFIHAPSSRGRVRVETMDGTYWPRRFLFARRVLR